MAVRITQISPEKTRIGIAYLFLEMVWGICMRSKHSPDGFLFLIPNLQLMLTDATIFPGQPAAGQGLWDGLTQAYHAGREYGRCEITAIAYEGIEPLSLGAEWSIRRFDQLGEYRSKCGPLKEAAFWAGYYHRLFLG